MASLARAQISILMKQSGFGILYGFDLRAHPSDTARVSCSNGVAATGILVFDQLARENTAERSSVDCSAISDGTAYILLSPFPSATHQGQCSLSAIADIETRETITLYPGTDYETTIYNSILLGTATMVSGEVQSVSNAEKEWARPLYGLSGGASGVTPGVPQSTNVDIIIHETMDISGSPYTIDIETALGTPALNVVIEANKACQFKFDTTVGDELYPVVGNDGPEFPDGSSVQGLSGHGPIKTVEFTIAADDTDVYIFAQGYKPS